MIDKKENKILEFIKEAVRLVGASAGVILLAIGMVMLLQALLKLYVFQIKTESYGDFSYRCARFDPMTPEVLPLDLAGPHHKASQKPKDLSAEEKAKMQKQYDECIKKEEQKAELRYKKSKKSDMADGVAFLIAGTVLLLMFRRKRKNSIF